MMIVLTKLPEGQAHGQGDLPGSALKVPLHLRAEVLGSDASTAPSTPGLFSAGSTPGESEIELDSSRPAPPSPPKSRRVKKARRQWRATRTRWIPWMRTTRSSWIGRSSRTCSSPRRVRPAPRANAAEGRCRAQAAPCSQAPFYE